MTLYEQAVIDAKKIKEEAIRYGETKILEKFAPKIEEAVSSILEQDPFDVDEEPKMADLDALDDLEGGGEVEGDELMDKLPLAAAEGEKLCQCPHACQCPEEDVEIEIDFDELMQVDDEEPNMGTGSQNPMYEEEEKDKPDCGDEEDRDVLVDLGGLEESILELAEELEVDIDDVTKTGWSAVPKSYKDHGEDVDLAKLQDDKEKEEFIKTKQAYNDLHKEMLKLEKQNKKLQKRNSIYESKIKKLNKISSLQQEKLSSLSDINMRLFYINEVLKSESLNGRQKNKIVEKLEKTNTTGEAKLVFESLQSTVGSSEHKKPESLREVAANVPQNFVARSLVEQKEAQQSESGDGFQNRWQKLAGIKR
jgi:hypothetical protein